MNTVLFVPGFQEGLNSRDYSAVITAIESRGYKTRFVEINWKRTTLKNWVQQLDAVYAKYDEKHTILAGFSFGSMTAFISASKRNPVELWLFSLSPYFSDDIPKMKQSWLAYIGKRRTEYFSQIEFNEYACKIKCKTLLFYGEVEAKHYPLIGRRSIAAHKVLEGSKLVVVSGVAHDVANPLYVRAIKQNI